MAQLGNTVVTGSLAVSNCIYGSVTCATSATTATNACKGWNGSAFASFGSNAFNSTAFTTCVGTVTSINIYCGTTCKCGITSSGNICLGANAFNSTSFTTCTGTVTAITVSVNGVSATSDSGCATASISLDNVPATNACCAKQICRCGYTGCYNFDVALVNGCSSVSDAYVYASCNCRLKFSSNTGTLSISDSNGCNCVVIDSGVTGIVARFATFTCYLATSCIYPIKALSTTTTYNDVSIGVVCGTSSSCKTTNFKFCSCDGRMHGDVCGNVYGDASNASTSDNSCNAKCITRNATCANGTCYILLTNSTGTSSGTCVYVSGCCSLTFNPSTGCLSTTKVSAILNSKTPSSPSNGDIWVD